MDSAVYPLEFNNFATKTTHKSEDHPRRTAPRTGKQEKLVIQYQHRVNGRIRAREVRVINGETNEQLGIMKVQDAIKKAGSLGLDLVEVAPNAEPPVCRIVDYGKFRYELAKHDKEKKHGTTKVKEVKFRVNIDDHDYVTKVRRSEGFLDKGNKLKVQLQFRGREMAHQDMGHALMARIKEDLNLISQVEMEPKQAGRAINMILAPLPLHRRKRRWLQPEEEMDEEEPEETDSEADDDDDAEEKA